MEDDSTDVYEHDYDRGQQEGHDHRHQEPCQPQTVLCVHVLH